VPAEGIPKGFETQMRFTSETSSDGVTEQLFFFPFAFGEIPGVLWTPESTAGTRPLILMGHGGGQNKKTPGFAAGCGFAVAAVDAPAHGDRPRTWEHSRLIGEMRSRIQAGGDVAPVLAEVHALIAGQSVPE
jgi:hypothetical protein